MDSDKQNSSLKSSHDKEGLNAAANTPEQNGQVKSSFATLQERVIAMLNDSRVENDIIHKLCAECTSAATKLSNLILKSKNGSP
jgi:hypothetical protein